METISSRTTLPQTNGHETHRHFVRKVGVEDFATASAGAFDVSAGGILSLNGVSYGPPDGNPNPEASRLWAELIEGLHNANQLSRLARALV